MLYFLITDTDSIFLNSHCLLFSLMSAIPSMEPDLSIRYTSLLHHSARKNLQLCVADALFSL